MNFHVASRGVAIYFDIPAGAGGGGSCLNCSNKIMTNDSSLACLLLINLLYLVRTCRKTERFLFFIFASPKVILFYYFYRYNHADFDRKLINQAFR